MHYNAKQGTVTRPFLGVSMVQGQLNNENRVLTLGGFQRAPREIEAVLTKRKAAEPVQHQPKGAAKAWSGSETDLTIHAVHGLFHNGQADTCAGILLVGMDGLKKKGG